MIDPTFLRPLTKEAKEYLNKVNNMCIHRGDPETCRKCKKNELRMKEMYE